MSKKFDRLYDHAEEHVHLWCYSGGTKCWCGETREGDKARRTIQDAQHAVENPGEYPAPYVDDCRRFLAHRDTAQALRMGAA